MKSATEGMEARYTVWFAADILFEGETTSKPIMFYIWHNGVIMEKAEFYNPSSGKYDPDLHNGVQVAGANRHGATVGIRSDWWDYEADFARVRPSYVTEVWAGPCPWKEEQLDPEYGEFLPRELHITADQPAPIRGTAGGMRDGIVYERRHTPEKRAQVQARLAAEAAERSTKR